MTVEAVRPKPGRLEYPDETEYPAEDDEPMVESKAHGKQIAQMSEQLEALFADDPHTFVGINMFIYYREGDSSARVAPDLQVSQGVRAAEEVRTGYFTWIEGKPPDVVFEFLSDKTAIRDRQIKPDLYMGEIGVTEQFLWQPRPDRRREFRGWRRIDGRVIHIVAEPFILATDEVVVAYYCEALDLWLVEEQTAEARLLRLYRPDGTPIPTLTEAIAQAEEAEKRATSAEKRATSAEKRATSAEKRAEREAAARAAAEAELARLREKFARRQDESPADGG
jgi:Uma2 family endonuclease